MDVAQIVKSTQEQGVAAWVDYLNQLRLNELLAKLTSQNMNLEQALAELQKMKVNIAALIENNRGGAKGMHGFIAETAEVGIENARNLIKGLDAVCEWINNNGPADILRNGTEIQQKFVRSGGISALRLSKPIWSNTLILFEMAENIKFRKISITTSKGFWRFLRKKQRRNLPVHINCGSGFIPSLRKLEFLQVI